MQSQSNSIGCQPPQNIDEGLNLVPIENKYALLHACMVCPDLVHRESPPLKFLEYEKYNFFAAAKRWAKYWDIRLKVFGEDRAFLPIADLTGNGALTEDLIPYVASGSAVILPPDVHERPVLFVDRSRLPLNCLHWSDECRKKLAFALFQKVMLLSQSFVIIFYVSTRPTFFPGLGKWIADALNDVFPTKLVTIHIAYTSPMSPRFKSFVTAYLPTLLRISNSTFRQFETNFHICDKEEMIAKFSQLGLQRDNLPGCVGGTWSYEIYDDYVRRLRRPICTPPPLVLPIAATGLGLSTNYSNSFEKESTTLLNNQILLNNLSDLSLSGADRELLIEQNNVQCILPQPNGILKQQNFLLDSGLADMPSHLAENEANYNMFLSLENGDIEKATSRLTLYWNFRKVIFKDRAFLPLQLNAGGALHDDDLLTLKCGYIALLPPNNQGRRVLCCDASRLAKDNLESRVRCFFYMLHVANKNISGEDPGISILFIMNKLSFERTKTSQSLSDMLKVYPAKIAAFHIIRQPARLGVSVFEEKVVPTLKTLLDINGIPIHIHVGTPTLREELAVHGFDSKNIPRSIGGGWTYEDFLKWRHQQLLLETSAPIQSDITYSTFRPINVNLDGEISALPMSLSTLGAIIPMQMSPNHHPVIQQQITSKQSELYQLQQQFDDVLGSY